MTNRPDVVYRAVRFLARWFLRLLYRVEVADLSGGRDYDRLVIVSNHQSFLDGILIATVLPTAPLWTVHSQIWAKWYIRLMLRRLPVMVVDTNSPGAVRRLLGIIEAGRHVCLFPEGRITVTGSLMKIYDGPAYLAARTGAWILPIRIDGALPGPFSRMGWWYPKRWFPRIRVTVMPAQKIEMPQGASPRERRRKATRAMRRLMQEMMFRTEPVTSLQEAFLDAVEFHGRDREVLQDIRLKPETYGHVLKAALALGRLVSKRTSPGERVGVLMPNVTTTASLLFGMFGARRIPAMLNYTLGGEGLRQSCELAGLKLVLTSRAFVARAKLEAKLAALRAIEVVYLEDLGPGFTLRDKAWLVLWALRFPRRVMMPASPDEPAVVMFTSGSEASPKGVVLSHRSILSNVNQMKAVIEFNREDRFLTSLPLFHAFGLTVSALLPVISGCRVFFYPSPLHYRTIPEIIYDQDCTILCGTPTFLANYAKAANPYDFYRVRYVVSGAEKLPEETRRLWLEKFGIRILEGYGITEYAPVVAANTPFAYRAGTVGEFLPGIEHRVVPLEGIPEGGVLHLKGPNSMLGYLRAGRPGVVDAPSSEVGPGWYNTGDVVSIEDGFVRIVSRVKRFAKVAGEMVSLEIAERLAAAASPSFRHAAVAQSEGRRGESIVLFTDDRSLRREALVDAAARTGAPDFAVPRRIVPIPKLPLLGNGKFDYVTLHSMAEQTAAR